VDFLFIKTGAKGRKIATTVFKVLYVLLVIVFVVLNELQKSIPDLPNELIWGVSDTANGLMALPNLIGLIFMGGLVAKITKNYFDRKKGKDVTPMISAYEDVNAQFVEEIAAEKAQAQAEEPALEQASKDENAD
jgi:AGCS family alanine or glycine:cation symporter